MGLHPAIDELDTALGLRRRREEPSTMVSLASPPTAPGYLAGSRYKTSSQATLFEQACSLAFRQRRIGARDKTFVLQNKTADRPANAQGGRIQAPQSREEDSRPLLPLRKGLLAGDMDSQVNGWQPAFAAGGLKQALAGVDMKDYQVGLGDAPLRSLRSVGAVMKVGHCAGGPLGPGAPLGSVLVCPSPVTTSEFLESSSPCSPMVGGMSSEVPFDTARLASIYKLAPRLLSPPLFAEGQVSPGEAPASRQNSEESLSGRSLPRVQGLSTDTMSLSMSFTENGPMIVRAVMPEPTSYAAAPSMLGRKELRQVQNRRKQRPSARSFAFPAPSGSTAPLESQASVVEPASPLPLRFVGAAAVKRSKSLPASGQTDACGKVRASDRTCCRLPRTTPAAASPATVKKKAKGKRFILPFACGEDDPRVAHLEATDGRILPEYLPV
mmetsp:Transcript_44458/g.81162  ORF Transcript_44458/g.81162 Transcript_44458/m.81162 type:complete len:440 (+) Transcript_44458:179-1498(+)